MKLRPGSITENGHVVTIDGGLLMHGSVWIRENHAHHAATRGWVVEMYDLRHDGLVPVYRSYLAYLKHTYGRNTGE